MYFTLSISVNQILPDNKKKIIELDINAWINNTGRFIYQLKQLFDSLDIDICTITQLTQPNNHFYVYYVVMVDKPDQNWTYLQIINKKNNIDYKLKFIDNYGIIMKIFHPSKWKVNYIRMPLAYRMCSYVFGILGKIEAMFHEVTKFPEIPYCQYTHESISPSMQFYHLMDKYLFYYGNIYIGQLTTTGLIYPQAHMIWKEY